MSSSEFPTAHLDGFRVVSRITVNGSSCLLELSLNLIMDGVCRSQEIIYSQVVDENELESARPTFDRIEYITSALARYFNIGGTRAELYDIVIPTADTIYGYVDSGISLRFPLVHFATEAEYAWMLYLPSHRYLHVVEDVSSAVLTQDELIQLTSEQADSELDELSF